MGFMCSSSTQPNLSFSVSFSPCTSSHSICNHSVFLVRKFLPIRFYSNTQFWKLHAIQLPNQLHSNKEEQEEEEDEEVKEVEKQLSSIPRKKKKKKLRPCFYDQTMDRWSVRSSSKRSSFPWQQESKKEKEDAVDGYIWENEGSARRYGSECTWNQVESFDLDGGKMNERLNSIVEKLNGCTEDVSLDIVDEGHSNSEDFVVDNKSFMAKEAFCGPLGRIVTPWLEEEKREGGGADFELSDNAEGEKQESSQMLIETLNFVEKVQISSQDEELKFDESDEDSDFVQSTSLAESCEREKPYLKEQQESKSIHSLVDDLAKSLSLKSAENLKESTEHKHKGLLVNRKGVVSSIVDELKNSMEQSDMVQDVELTIGDCGDDGLKFGHAIVEKMGGVKFPWEREKSPNEKQVRRRSNTELAERSIPESELKRLRGLALRMKERMKVGPAGVTKALVESIHMKWRMMEVVKLRFEGPPSLNMKRTHEILETRTGGVVIWRSGSLLVLYKGMTYDLPCVQSYNSLGSSSSNKGNPLLNGSTAVIVGNIVKDSDVDEKMSTRDSMAAHSCEESLFSSEVDSLLDQLGPRFRDWSGRDPLPVDADLLPGVVPGYKPPYRLLPYKTRSSLRNRDMTSLRRLARSMPPHFALGRNRQHQGLANAMVKLWEKSIIAKIAIKRGVPNTTNDRMAEEIKKLTGGVLLSRNKDYIVFYRGNDFLSPSIREVLVQKQRLATVKLDEEELARLSGSSVVSNLKAAKSPLVAGTLAETLQAHIHWANLTNDEDRQKTRRELALAKHASLVRGLERKLVLAKAKVRKAEQALAKVQEFLHPAELPTDLETVTDEERFLFRKIGLKMRSFLVLGRRGVFDGTIQNMHLSWKYRELVKIFVKRKSFPQVKHIAISLEAESGGVLISLDKTTKGYAIVMYRGKNYQRPQILRPKNLLTRRQALARAIELQRREALNHHIANLQEKIELMKSQLEQMEAGKEVDYESSSVKIDDSLFTDDDDDLEEEGEEAYLQTYYGSDEDME